MGAKYYKELHASPIVFNAIASYDFLLIHKLVGLKGKCHVLRCMLNCIFSFNVFEVAFCLLVKFGVNKCHFVILCVLRW
jgi:hypothetical protein